MLDMRPVGRSDGGDVVLRFDRVVAAAQALPEANLAVESQSRDGTWEAVPGQTTWTRTDRLGFVPTDDFPSARRVRVRLEGPVQDVDDVTWAFETARPTVEFEETWEPVKRRQPLQISVDEPTAPTTMAEHLRVKGADGRDITVRVRALKATDEDEKLGRFRFAIHPRSRWPVGDTLTVSVAPSFRADGGVLPLETPLEWTVETLAPFRLGGVSCDEQRGSTCPLGPILLRFTDDPQEVSGIRMIPEPDDFIVWQGDGGAVLDGDFRSGQRYRIVVPEDTTDWNDRALRGPRTTSVRFSETRASGDASLALSSARGIFASVGDAHIGVLTERVKEAQLRVVVLDADAGAPYVEALSEEEVLPWPTGGAQTEVLLRFPTRRRNQPRGRTVDLGRWAKAGDTVVVELRATELEDRARGVVEPVRGVFRISGLGLWVHSGPARGVVRVTDLHTGRPRPDVDVAIRGESGTQKLGKTDSDGLAALPGAVELDPDTTVVAQGRGDALAVPLATYDWAARRRGYCKVSSEGVCQWTTRRGWPQARTPLPEAPPAPLRRGERVVQGIQVGRGVYMPGDTVHVAGWAGVNTPHGEHNNRQLPEGTPVELALERASRGARVELAVGRTEVNEHGRFSASLTVPKGAALGSHLVVAKILGAQSQTRLLVAEPRIPAFEVQAEARHWIVGHGDPLNVDIGANSFSGEPAPMLQLDWTASCYATTPYLPELEEGFSARTDADVPDWSTHGRLETNNKTHLLLAVGTEALDHRSYRQCTVAVSAQDASRQPIGAQASVAVKPGPGFLAASIPEIEAGTRPRIVARVVGNEGQPKKADSIRIQLERGWEEPRRVLTTCNTVDPDLRGAPPCRPRKLAAGRYTVRITAEVGGAPLELLREIRVRKPRRRPREAAPPAATRTAPTPEPRKFRVHAPQRVKYGEAFDVRISGPWNEARGLMTVEQSGLRESRPFLLEGGESVVRVAARRGAGELLQLTARVALPPGPEDGEQPRVVDAALSIRVHDRDALRVIVVPPEHPQPGTKTGFEVRVRDEDDQPVDARLAIWIVDDALHSLRRPQRAYLARIFNPLRPFDQTVTDAHRDLLRPFTPHLYRRAKRVPRVRQAKAMVKGALDTDVRQRFVPVPLFVGDVATGPDGVVRVPLDLADDLTRFRISVVASAELEEGTGPARFGAEDQTFEVTAPLPVRAALPRALRPGDNARIAAIVTVPSAGELRVVAHSEQARVQLRGPTSQTRRVAAGDVVRVGFGVHAGAPGDAEIRFSAALRTADGETLQGAVLRPMPVSAERTAIERAAVYGRLNSDRPVAVPLVLPTAGRGRIGVAVSSTILGDLQDATDYLVEYPYGCVEQTSSRLIPLIAMRGRVDRPEDVDAQIGKALAHLQSMQLDDGRFSYWPGGAAPSSFGTAYATWVLLQAKEAGVRVPPKGLARALEALGQAAATEVPADANGREQILIERALAVWALAHSDALPASALDALWPYREEMPVFARLLFLQALHRTDPADARIKPLLVAVSASIEQRAGVAHVVDPTERGRWWYAFSSAARTEALTLMTLMQVSPQDPRIEKLVRGLRDRRRGGRWRTTQENAFALLAMSRYAARSEAEVPKQRVQAWIGAQRVVDAEFVGLDADSVGGVVGLRRALEDPRPPHVVVQREGAGRTYYRVGVEWTTPHDAPARAQGVSITRTMPASVKLGARTLVEITLTNDATLHHLAVEVPLPAGLEAVDTQLGAGARARVAAGVRASPYVSHSELRPDRIVLFFDELPPGTTRHSVPLVATTSGQFTLPAAVAEAMYEPQTRARTAQGTVVVTRE